MSTRGLMRIGVADSTRMSPLAALTTHVVNPVMRLFAGYLPGLGCSPTAAAGRGASIAPHCSS